MRLRHLCRMATRRVRDNAVACSAKDLYIAWRQAKDDEELLRARLEALETENATLKRRLESLRRAAAPSVVTKIETTEAQRPIGTGFLPPTVSGSNNYRRPCTSTSNSRVSSDGSTTSVVVGSRVAELERKLAALDRRRTQEVARWRKKYDDLQEKWMKRGGVEPADDRVRDLGGKRGSLQQRSRSRVGTSSSSSSHLEELRVDNEQCKEKNRRLVLENEELSKQVDEMKTIVKSGGSRMHDDGVNRKLRDLLDRSERKVEELQRTNLKLHSMIKEANYKLRSGSRSSLAKDMLSMSAMRF